MATNASNTTAANVLKTLYPQKEIETLAYKRNPLFAKIKKNKNFVGKNQTIALRYGNQNGRSANFATAKANATPNLYGAFTITRVSDYGVGGITTEAIRTARDGGALVDELKESLDGVTYALTRSICNALYGNGGGAIAQIQGVGVGTFPGGVPGTTVTTTATQFILNDPSQVVWFEVGMTLEAATTDGTSGSRRSGQMTITAVDRDNGVITVSALIAGLAANDYLFTQDDFGAKMKGLAAWLPATPPVSGDNFFGQDRSFDTVRMAGIRWAGNGAPIEETVQSCTARIAREGGQPDTLFMNPVDVNNMVLSENSKVVVQSGSGATPTVGFKTVRFVTQLGDIEVYSDPNCPKGIAYLLQMDTWTLWSAGDMPGFLDDDGNGKLMRDFSSDSVQFRMGYYANLACTAPGYNARISL